MRVADIKKVIKALEHCINEGNCMECVYFDRAEGAINCPVDNDALALLKEQQAEIERMKRDGKTCANCSMSKIRMARGTYCYYRRCKKYNMWVRHGFYCSDWQKEGDENAD